MRIVQVVVGTLFVTACASRAPTVPAPQAATSGGASPGVVAADEAPPCPRSTELTAAGVREEAACLLQRYVRIDTTNPPGGELAAAAFLASVLARDGIEAQVIASAPGRANLYARIPGAKRDGALVLVHHMDVVPAQAEEWQQPPFEGVLQDDYLWGRGALDNKGAGIIQLVTLLTLHRQGITLPRDVILLGVADEEAGGGHGARFMMAHHRALFGDVAGVLNEGGGILQLGRGAPLYSVEVAQKAPFWVRVVARGASGHGSKPHPAAATHVLARALGRLEAHRFAVNVLPEVQRVFTARAQQKPEAERAPYLDLATSLAEDPAFRQRFLSHHGNAALVRNTLSITQLQGSDKENVLPGTATAMLDLRLLPGEDPDVVLETLRKVIAEPAVELEVQLSWTAHRSSPDTPLFKAIAELAKQRHPDSPVVPNVIGGFTDCNAFRAAGMTCYGFVPLRLTPADFAGFHGKDERLSVPAMTDAIEALAQLLRGLP